MTVRHIPIVCLAVSLARLFTGKLVFSRAFIGRTIPAEHGERFTVFRHVAVPHRSNDDTAAVLLVRFRFKTFSDRVNRFISRFPMLLITGYPGFRATLYAVNHDNGYWTGLYEWESMEAIERYKKSFVLRMMNRRAVAGSVSCREFPETCITDFMKKPSERKVNAL